ncbi:MAG: lysylphosphatidylglycerol synthase transmembrane domain-containing protein [Calditrichota bacterium]
MRNRKVWIGFGISLALVYFIIWKPHFTALFSGREGFASAFFGHSRIDVHQILHYLNQVNWLSLVIVFLLNPVHVLVRSHRWKLMIEPVGRLRLRDSFSIQMVGYFANTVLPLRAGELLRVVLVGERGKMSRSSALATVVLERLLDVITTIIIIIIVSIMNKILSGEVEGLNRRLGPAAVIITLGATAATILILRLVLAKDPLAGWTGRLIRLLPERWGNRLEGVFLRFVQGFAVLKSSRHYFSITIETIILWSIYTTQVFLALTAFGFTENCKLIAEAPVFASLILVIFSAVGLSIPSAPGGVGTFHAAMVLALSMLGMEDTDLAVGFAVILHATTIGFYALGGLIAMGRESLHFSEINRMVK